MATLKPVQHFLDAIRLFLQPFSNTSFCSRMSPPIFLQRTEAGRIIDQYRIILRLRITKLFSVPSKPFIQFFFVRSVYMLFSQMFLMECEMCGRVISSAVKARVEGSVLSVCNNCSQFGDLVDVRAEVRDRRRITLDTKTINPNFAKIIRTTRISSVLSVEQLAEKMGEKASVVERVEKGMRPTDELAKKLEKALSVKLFGAEEAEFDSKKKDTSQSLGDIAVIKHKKK